VLEPGVCGGCEDVGGGARGAGGGIGLACVAARAGKETAKDAKGLRTTLRQGRRREGDSPQWRHGHNDGERSLRQGNLTRIVLELSEERFYGRDN
jgi:hypothetical protein